MQIVVRPATAGDLDAIVRLRSAAEDWLIAQRIEQWRKGDVTPSDIEHQIQAGEWQVALHDQFTCAALRVLWSDALMWQKEDTFAAYVHGLVIDRSYAGRGLGTQLISWAEGQAKSAGAPALRLDCVRTNGRLRRYYAEHGFREVGERDLGERWLSVVLMEKMLDE